ncbi:hypothetical protein [Vibrio diabolicus]|uniref:hypothetical protein n=1 Tax=Vibrio diabolicus TaxID=50719 RepID=UPI00215FD061|nr:hypothetical protein [Vibrio diabolicus]MCS0388308.1 hypothetical protein [Vibrio diabolicus]
MVVDAFTSIKAYMYDRISSPLLGSLLISWMVWNYKLLILLFSSVGYSDKLRYINVLYSSSYEVYVQGLLLPIVTTLLYIFVFPFPAQWVYQFSLKKQKELADIKNEIEDSKLLTVEQSRAVRQKLLEVQREHDLEIEQKDRLLSFKDQDIQRLSEQIEDLNNQLAKAKVVEQKQPSVNPARLSLSDKVRGLIEVPEAQQPSSEEEYLSKILKKIYRSQTLSRSDILNGFSDPVKARYYLDELQQQGIVDFMSHNTSYSLPHEVKGVFVKHT